MLRKAPKWLLDPLGPLSVPPACAYLFDAEGRALDYAAFAQRIESLRAKYEQQGVQIHVTGFAKIVGDLIAGLRQVLIFFAVAIAIAAAIAVIFGLLTVVSGGRALFGSVDMGAVVLHLRGMPLRAHILDLSTTGATKMA